MDCRVKGPRRGRPVQDNGPGLLRHWRESSEQKQVKVFFYYSLT
jgi:plasmid stabilization system protein ParE